MDTKKLRQKILDLAIRGKLVPQDPNDEPASVLLERIRAEKEQLIKEGKIKRSKKSAATDKSHYENVPFEIPENWVWVEMSDIFLLNPKNDINDNVDGGFIPMACVCDGYSGEHTFITKQWGDIKRGGSHFQNGDIGIAKISPCFENRKSVIFSDLPNNIGSGTTELVVLRGILVNTAFYLLLIKSDWYISEGTKYFKGVVGQQRVHKDIFTTLQVPMPPLREQQKIVDSVKKWFSVIDEIENGATELETVIKQTKSKILDLAISGKLVLQDPNDEPAIELLKRINPAFQPCDNSHYENLPQGWVVCRLEDVCQICDNQRQPINSTERQERKKRAQTLYPYYGATGQVDWIDDYMLDGTFILLGEDGAPFLEKFADKAYVVSGKIWVNNHAHILKPNCDITYLTYYLNRYDYSKCVNGSTRLKLTQADMKNMTIVLPPLVEQHRIAGRIENIFRMLDAITAEL